MNTLQQILLNCNSGHVSKCLLTTLAIIHPEMSWKPIWYSSFVCPFQAAYIEWRAESESVHNLIRWINAGSNRRLVPQPYVFFMHLLDYLPTFYTHGWTQNPDCQWFYSGTFTRSHIMRALLRSKNVTSWADDCTSNLAETFPCTHIIAHSKRHTPEWCNTAVNTFLSGADTEWGIHSRKKKEKNTLPGGDFVLMFWKKLQTFDWLI